MPEPKTSVPTSQQVSDLKAMREQTIVEQRKKNKTKRPNFQNLQPLPLPLLQLPLLPLPFSSGKSVGHVAIPSEFVIDNNNNNKNLSQQQFTFDNDNDSIMLLDSQPKSQPQSTGDNDNDSIMLLDSQPKSQSTDDDDDDNDDNDPILIMDAWESYDLEQSVNIKMKPNDIIDIITEKKSISWRSLVNVHNKWRRKNGFSSYPTRRCMSVEQVLNVICCNICPKCVDDGCTWRCSKCPRWLHPNCLRDGELDCDFCLGFVKR